LTSFRSGVFDDDKCNPESAHIMNVVGYGWGFWKFNEAIQNWEWKKIDYWVNLKINSMVHSEKKIM
jgi:hypothetical protein